MKQTTIAQKLRVMSKLREMGYKDEKAVAAISLEDIIIKYEIPTVELKIIAEIKKALKEGKLYSYLQEAEEKENAKVEEVKNNEVYRENED